MTMRISGYKMGKESETGKRIKGIVIKCEIGI
jgi:hypothetical protein